MVERLRANLSMARRITITCDIWSSKLKGTIYFGLTAHFINGSTRKRQNLRLCKTLFKLIFVRFTQTPLGCRIMNDGKSGDAVAKMLDSILREFGIHAKVWFCITDGGGEMIKGW